MIPVLVGRRAGQPERDRNWAFNRARWESWGYDVYEGHHDGPGPYNMAVASNRAAAAAGDWDVAVYAGADHFAGWPQQVEQAVTIARSGHQLVFAHEYLTLLDEAESEFLIAAACRPEGATGTRHPNTFSGVLAFSRKLYEDVGGFDERFVGWGWEDLAFWAACSAIANGYQRVPGDIYHLWHPSSWEENEGSPNHPPNELLGRRYLAAKADQAQMRAILAER